MGRIRAKGSVFSTRKVDDIPSISHRDINRDTLKNIGAITGIANTLYKSPIIRDAAAGIESLFSGSDEEKSAVVEQASSSVATEQQAAKARLEASKADAQADRTGLGLTIAGKEEQRISEGLAAKAESLAPRTEKGEDRFKGLQVEWDAAKTQRADIIPQIKQMEMDALETEFGLRVMEKELKDLEKQRERAINVSMNDVPGFDAGLARRTMNELNGEIALKKQQLMEEANEYKKDKKLISQLKAQSGKADELGEMLQSERAEVTSQWADLSEASKQWAAESSRKTKAEVDQLVAEVISGDRLLSPEEQRQVELFIQYEEPIDVSQYDARGQILYAIAMDKKAIEEPEAALEETADGTPIVPQGEVPTDAAEVPLTIGPGLPEYKETTDPEGRLRTAQGSIIEDYLSARPDIAANLAQNREFADAVAHMDPAEQKATLDALASLMGPPPGTGGSLDLGKPKTVAAAQSAAMEIAQSRMSQQQKSEAMRELLGAAGDLSDVKSRFAAGGSLGYHHEGSARKAILEAYKGMVPKRKEDKPLTAKDMATILKKQASTEKTRVQTAREKEKLAKELTSSEVDIRNKYISGLPSRLQKAFKAYRKGSKGPKYINLEELREENLTDASRANALFGKQITRAQGRSGNITGALTELAAGRNPLADLTEAQIIEKYGSDIAAYRRSMRAGELTEVTKQALKAKLLAGKKRNANIVSQSIVQRDKAAKIQAILKKMGPDLPKADKLKAQKELNKLTEQILKIQVQLGK